MSLTKSIVFNDGPFELRLINRLHRRKDTCEFKVNDSVIRLKEACGSACFLIVQN
jgi:hypothetical protein